MNKHTHKLRPLVLALALCAVQANAGELYAPQTELNPEGDQFNVELRFPSSQSGDAYVAVQIADGLFFLAANGSFTPQPTPLISANPFRSRYPLFNFVTDNLPPGQYIVHHVVTRSGTDVMNPDNWIGGLHSLPINIAEPLLGSNLPPPLLEDYGWSENAGWLNLRSAQGQLAVFSDHLEGFAWAENIGWIKLGSHSGGGAHSYANSSSSDWGVNNSNGTLSGYAWSENAGWINFAPTGGGVSVSNNVLSGYAWGENIGWIFFAGTDNVAPDASVSLNGVLKVGSSLSGSYVYSDNDSDPEGSSTMQWYRADDAAATQGLQAISGATTNSYTLTSTDENKYIAFAVTPVAQSGISPGQETTSNFSGPVWLSLLATPTHHPDLLSLNPGGWTMTQHPRMLADVNGDGKDDLVGFGCCSVWVALSNGNGFDNAQSWVDGFGAMPNYGGWEVAKHLRTMADVNGDGKADVIGFGNDNVIIALSNGTGFDTPVNGVTGAFAYNQGWRVTDNPRYVVDVNADGKEDIVGFAGDGVYVSTSTGSGFNAPQLWVAAFGGFANAGGWDPALHPRMMADVNGDGMMDVVGFGNDGIGIGLSTGSNFTPQDGIQGQYGYNQGWRVDQHPRLMADVNGDGKDDVVGFAYGGAYVAPSNGSSFNPPSFWLNDFGHDQGWRTNQHLRFMADVDGDNKDDIIGFGAAGVFVSRSTGLAFDTPQTLLADMAYTQGYRVGTHPRMVGDINGDGKAEPIAIHDNGTLSSVTGY